MRGQPKWEACSSEIPKMDRQKGAGAAELGGFLKRNTENGAAKGVRGQRAGAANQPRGNRGGGMRGVAWREISAHCTLHDKMVPNNGSCVPRHPAFRYQAGLQICSRCEAKG